jgi:hypothetical protein
MGTLAEHLSPIPELLAGGVRAVFIGSVMGAPPVVGVLLRALSSTTALD